jgi:hypothetical protein
MTISRTCSLTAAVLISMCLLSPARADAIFTDQGQFLTDVAPGYFLETFSSLSSQYYPNPLNFSGSGFAYTASAPDGLYPAYPASVSNGIALETNSSLDPLNIVFTGAPVTAVGGYLFDVNQKGKYLQGDITIKLNDGTQFTVPNASLTSFVGITTDAPIQSLTIYTDEYALGDVLGYEIWPATQDLVVGTAAPEPGTLILVIGTGLPFIFLRALWLGRKRAGA